MTDMMCASRCTNIPYACISSGQLILHLIGVVLKVVTDDGLELCGSNGGVGISRDRCLATAKGDDGDDGWDRQSLADEFGGYVAG